MILGFFPLCYDNKIYKILDIAKKSLQILTIMSIKG